MSASASSCPRCGDAVPVGAAFCPACGVRLADAPPARSHRLERLGWAVRARVRAAVDSLAVRTQAQKRVARLQLELDEAWRRKSRLLTDLGHAVYTGDAAGTDETRAQLRALDAEIEAKEREMVSVTAEAARQLEEARARAAPTAVQPPIPPTEPTPEPLTPPAPEPLTPPAPPTIPEPTPVPSEPPAPPQVPEPSPVPHEPPIPGDPDTPTRPS